MREFGREFTKSFWIEDHKTRSVWRRRAFRFARWGHVAFEAPVSETNVFASSPFGGLASSIVVQVVKEEAVRLGQISCNPMAQLQQAPVMKVGQQPIRRSSVGGRWSIFRQVDLEL